LSRLEHLCGAGLVVKHCWRYDTSQDGLRLRLSGEDNPPSTLLTDSREGCTSLGFPGSYAGLLPISIERKHVSPVGVRAVPHIPSLFDPNNLPIVGFLIHRLNRLFGAEASKLRGY